MDAVLDLSRFACRFELRFREGLIELRRRDPPRVRPWLSCVSSSSSSSCARNKNDKGK